MLDFINYSRRSQTLFWLIKCCLFPALFFFLNVFGPTDLDQTMTLGHIEENTYVCNEGPWHRPLELLYGSTQMHNYCRAEAALGFRRQDIAIARNCQHDFNSRIFHITNDLCSKPKQMVK